MTRWLARLTDAATGRTPRLGHDDGTVLYDALGSHPDDARPCLVRAQAAFGEHAAEPFAALAGIGTATTSDGERVWLDRDGGTAGLRDGPTIVLLRLPCGRFAPGQGDVMHVSVMHEGQEVLRDAGSYLYNPPGGEGDLAGTRHHSTVQWGGQDRPPRLSRWVFATLPRTASVAAEAGRLFARDRHHTRTVVLRDGLCTVIDQLDRPDAVLRWRLQPDRWVKTEAGAYSPSCSLTVRADGEVGLRLGWGWDSPAYGRKQVLPVLEVRCGRGTRCVVTVVRMGPTSCANRR